MEDIEILHRALDFHGHRCWAGVAGVRAGLAAMRVLGVKRAGGTQLYAIVELGEAHRGMGFADGVQYTTGCTFGKGNLRRQAYGKLAVTLVDKASGRAVRVSYKPALQKKISESAFMKQRAAGVAQDDISEADQMAMVHLVWDAPEADVLTVGEVFSYPEKFRPDPLGFVKCDACGELVSGAYLRVMGTQHVCIPCSGYER